MRPSTWVDHTLARLEIPARRLIGGTKGSHLLTANAELRTLLAGRGVYAEATDGRPIFIIPLADMTLIGTTDEPFEERPEKAVATQDELDYLVDTVCGIFPQLGFSRARTSIFTTAACVHCHLSTLRQRAQSRGVIGSSVSTAICRPIVSSAAS